jgi:DMSO/TMAO reductase YedYZ molybdopterin-dependent catalytic subunit
LSLSGTEGLARRSLSLREASLHSRRWFLGNAGVIGLGLVARPSWAGEMVSLPFPSEPRSRPITSAFPEKGSLILQRTRPPLLETPMSVFNDGVLTPNEKFYVRWHWAVIPEAVDVDKFRLAVRGHVGTTLSLTLDEILRMPRVELIAVNQCSGNSRGYFQPRVPGAQWSNGAMGNARWTGVLLKDVLNRAGVKAGAVRVRLNGMDTPVVDGAPDFLKSLDINHALDDEVMIAFAMNGEQLPLLNGFPLRLIVPGWYSTYWVKMLNDIEVLDRPDDGFWMATAYTIPDTPFANVKPGETGVKLVAINRMGQRSFVTNIEDGAKIAAGSRVNARGIAFGGDTGVGKVEFSSDAGKTWQLAKLGADFGKYSFRRWEIDFTSAKSGDQTLMVKCTNTDNAVQPEWANWNPSGFMRSVIEAARVTVT